jgi:CBS domain-containing protein
MGTAVDTTSRGEALGSILPDNTAATNTVRQVLAAKSLQQVVTIDPLATVYDALCLMAEHNVGALVVVDFAGVQGIISERDYARKVILVGKTSRETAVEEIMATPAVTVGPDTTVAECMALMTGKFLRHLPVIEGGALIGLVSIGDVVKTIIAEQSERIGKFEEYITGAYPT